MASQRLPHVLGCCCAIGALALFGAAAAAAGYPEAAESATQKVPKITGLKILALTTTGKLPPCPDMKVSRPSRHRRTQAAAAPGKPCAEAVASLGTTVSYRLAILGENLAPEGAPTPVVKLATEDPGHPAPDPVVDRVAAQEIDVSGEAPVPTSIKSITVQIGGRSCVNASSGAPANCRLISSPPGSTISITATPTNALKEFQVKLEPQTNKEFPNLHSLLVTRESGDSGAGFADKASHMQVDLEPTGATDLRIVQTNQQQMELHYVAAADYKPKNVVVTVFDSSNIDDRKPVAVAKPAAKTPDPNAPKINNVEVDFVNRAHGIGRIHIYGKGFGKVPRPGYPVDDYLCDCLEASRRSGYRACSVHGDDPGPAQRTDNLTKDAKSIDCPAYELVWERFQQGLRGNVTVGVNSRDPQIRVEKAKIIDMNDDMIDVYFEFTRYNGYAWPFRLAGVDLTITKNIKKTSQAVKADTISAQVDEKGPATFTAAQSIGPKPDASLTYQYSVLDYDGARSQLGSIVADNFYVVQLAVVNTGKKKVSIPLANIQAEVEWLHGKGKKTRYSSKYPWPFGQQEVQEIFMEGPPTLAPAPLAAVSGFFGIYQSESGRRVKLFNILNGITTFVTALIPIAGPSLKDAEVVYSGGFIPGLGKAWPDLSPQQLQHLTSLSWQDTETVAANGGAVSKYIYIQRTQQFGDMPESTPLPNPDQDPPRRTMRQISNLLDIEVTGYEVPDTPAKDAAPKSSAQQTAPKASTDPSATQDSTQESGSPAPPPTPPAGTASTPPPGQ